MSALPFPATCFLGEMPSKKTGKIIAIRTKFKNPLKAWKRNNPLHGRSPAAGIHVVSAQILGLQGLPAPGLQASTAATPSRYWARDVSDAIQISAPLQRIQNREDLNALTRHLYDLSCHITNAPTARTPSEEISRRALISLLYQCRPDTAEVQRWENSLRSGIQAGAGIVMRIIIEEAVSSFLATYRCRCGTWNDTKVSTHHVVGGRLLLPNRTYSEPKAADVGSACQNDTILGTGRDREGEPWAACRGNAPAVQASMHLLRGCTLAQAHLGRSLTDSAQLQSRLKNDLVVLVSRDLEALPVFYRLIVGATNSYDYSRYLRYRNCTHLRELQEHRFSTGSQYSQQYLYNPILLTAASSLDFIIALVAMKKYDCKHLRVGWPVGHLRVHDRVYCATLFRELKVGSET
ncbi:hypothetical protein F5J12DRAFT_925673 [Pisolithus orientalis]|uniref:uncharacterized protein n=1 Tax=Pisolithus orientalis TaxID=936130 RepID=UPI0022246D09|nr:uncharacterized protein F5J12DRAFT_925673 [Pisolithus orientalis]KAI6025823.1 hypothetical protein F5J12DRAFT_925673 [Pisolithus orientalis]